MTSIWLPSDSTSIKDFSVNGKGTTTLVRVTIEVTDPHQLGYLVSSLGEAQRDLAQRRAAKKGAARPPAKKQKQVGAERRLLLEDLRGDRS